MLGGTLENDRHDRFEIVGFLKSDCYFMVGVAGDIDDTRSLVALSSGKNIDYGRLLKNTGFDTGRLFIADSFTRNADIEYYIDKMISYVYLTETVSLIVLIICLMLIYNLHLRNRIAEWCFFNAIGFSKSEIYLSMLRELFFVLVFSVLLGVIGVLIAFLLIYFILLQPSGISPVLRFMEQNIESVVYMWLMCALLQPFVYFNMQRIDTIDTVEEEFV
jgi:ABC-type antimicrobial peptide transport system permease subunit